MSGTHPALGPSPPRGDASGDFGPVPVTSIEQETGLSKEVVRKWEDRFGFPKPLRDSQGNRLYPRDQVASLRLIQRLISAGYRPRMVVGRPMDVLEQMVAKVTAGAEADAADEVKRVLGDIRQGDHMAVRHALTALLRRQGLPKFVRETAAPLSALVGEAWLRRDIHVFQERLFSEALTDILREACLSASNADGHPRILMTTPPGENHVLGLRMAEAVLALDGACCINVGPELPAAELAVAADRLRVDIVALSLSLAFPERSAAAFLRELRKLLPDTVEIWVGGMGANRGNLSVPGVRFVPDISTAEEALKHFAAR